MTGIRLVAGLGNPGPEYLRNRHNAGFWFADALATGAGQRFGSESRLHSEGCRVRIGGQQVRVIKPGTFMNESGRAVVAALNYWKLVPGELLVVHDDLDLPPGTARLKFDGGHGGQNGLRDIMAQLGHGRFHRLRIGIGHPGDRDRVTPWVLGNPSAADEDAILDAIARALDVLPLAVAGDFNEATKRLHTNRDPGPGTRDP
ncbi:MAG TPA: aminoacyl-tRNA hydrolase [Rhodanobacteraceae bacterium]|jgi:PTH1 family peptidyl-tRNA hydrolase|nr:aminoacyl-tRNA hydrolase [Rhodanobacteraceae bacterium]